MHYINMFLYYSCNTLFVCRTICIMSVYVLCQYLLHTIWIISCDALYASTCDAHYLLRIFLYFAINCDALYVLCQYLWRNIVFWQYRWRNIC